MKNEDLSDEAIKALEILKRWNDEENHAGPPAPETALAEELVKYGLIRRVKKSYANIPEAQAIVGHEITEKGRKLLRGENII